jgi:hypothetical protein
MSNGLSSLALTFEGLKRDGIVPTWTESAMWTTIGGGFILSYGAVNKVRPSVVGSCVRLL